MLTFHMIINGLAVQFIPKKIDKKTALNIIKWWNKGPQKVMTWRQFDYSTVGFVNPDTCFPCWQWGNKGGCPHVDALRAFLKMDPLTDPDIRMLGKIPGRGRNRRKKKKYLVCETDTRYAKASSRRKRRISTSEKEQKYEERQRKHRRIHRNMNLTSSNAVTDTENPNDDEFAEQDTTNPIKVKLHQSIFDGRTIELMNINDVYKLREYDRTRVFKSKYPSKEFTFEQKKKKKIRSD